MPVISSTTIAALFRNYIVNDDVVVDAVEPLNFSEIHVYLRKNLWAQEQPWGLSTFRVIIPISDIHGRDLHHLLSYILGEMMEHGFPPDDMQWWMLDALTAPSPLGH